MTETKGSKPKKSTVSGALHHAWKVTKNNTNKAFRKVEEIDSAITKTVQNSLKDGEESLKKIENKTQWPVRESLKDLGKAIGKVAGVYDERPINKEKKNQAWKGLNTAWKGVKSACKAQIQRAADYVKGGGQSR